MLLPIYLLKEKVSSCDAEVQTDECMPCTLPDSVIISEFDTLNFETQETVLSTLLCSHATTVHNVAVPKDFLNSLFVAAYNLKDARRSNIIFKLCRVLAGQDNGGKSRIPLKRMAIGMLEHIINFYTVSSLEHVSLFVCLFYFLYHTMYM